MTEDKNKYILSINGMSKSFGRNKVLKHISMNVKPGTIMGLMGENGAGKSTMMKCLFGTYQKDEGTIVLDGKEVNFSGPKDALENGVQEKGIYLAAQCCEHLNRALILETEAAEKYGYEPVNVMPQPKAGGSFATAAWQAFADPVAVEHIAAHAGMDIGDTLIGMHLKDVAVPVRLSIRQIGEAHLVCARTRRKFVGGVRAVYDERYL